MLNTKKHFEIEADVHLFDPSKGRKSYIATGYRPHIYFGYSDLSALHSSDCIISLIHKQQLFPGENATVLISVLKYSHLTNLLKKNVRIQIKEGARIIGEGKIVKRIGEMETC